MPTGRRIRDNNVLGNTLDNPLIAGAVTFNSAGLASLGVVAAPDHAVITLDPLRQYGNPEIVVVTVHTAAATVATITRGQYGTVARSHPLGTLFLHAAIDEDFIEVLTTATRPTDPYIGQSIFNQTLNAVETRNTASLWQNINMLADPPACRVYHNAAQSIADAVTTASAFNSERFDTDSMHDMVTNNSRITFNTAGVYIVSWCGVFTGSSDYNGFEASIRLNGTTRIATTSRQHNIITFSPEWAVTTVFKFSVGQYIEATLYQDNGANAARNLLVTGNESPEFSAVWVGRG